MKTVRNPVIWLTAVSLAALLAVLLGLASMVVDQSGSDGESAPGDVSVGSDAIDGAESGTAEDRTAVVSVRGEKLTIPSSDRPTVLYFMASWCTSCIEQARALNELENEYAEKMHFIGVDVTPGATKEEVENFRAQAGNPDHPYVVDTTQQFVERYEIAAIDSTVVVGTDGKLLARADAKPMNTAALREFLERALEPDRGAKEPTPQPVLP